VWAGVAVAVGVWFAGHYAPGSWLAAAAIVALAILGFVAIVRPALRSLWLYAVLAAVGAAHLWVDDSLRPASDIKYHSRTNTPVSVYGRIDAEPDVRARATLLTVAVDSIDYGDSVCVRTGQILVRLDDTIRVNYGEYLVLNGSLRPLPGARNPGEFDYAKYLRRRGIHAELVDADGPLIMGRADLRESGWTASVVAPLRHWITRHLSFHVHGSPGALLLGLLFGERRLLDHQLLRQFQDTGTLHLLAVSGSNVAVVIGVVWGTLALLRVPHLPRIITTLAALVLFCALSRNEPSVVRASVAGGLLLLGRSWHRATDPLNIWGGALLLILLVRPSQLFDVGFQLSFAAALGIILAIPLLGRHPRGNSWWARAARPIVALIGVSVAAQLAVTPILAANFNRVPLVTPLSNLVCVPAAGLATAAGLVTLLAAPIGGWVLSTLSAATWLFVQLLVESVAFFDRLHLPLWEMRTPGGLETVGYYVLLACTATVLLSPRRRRRAIFVAVLAANIWVWSGAFAGSSSFRMLVFDTGPGAVSALRWPNGRVWLLEQTAGRRSSQYRGTVLPFLRRSGWGEPDLILTLDPRTALATSGSIWPSAPRLISQSSPPDALEARGSSAAWTLHSLVDGDDSTLCGLRLQAPRWELIWLREFALIQRLQAFNRPCWVVVPELPPMPFSTPPIGRRLTIIEAARRPGHENRQFQAPAVQIMRTLTSGGILISDAGDSLRTESSIR